MRWLDLAFEPRSSWSSPDPGLALVLADALDHLRHLHLDPPARTGPGRLRGGGSGFLPLAVRSGGTTGTPVPVVVFAGGPRGLRPPAFRFLLSGPRPAERGTRHPPAPGHGDPCPHEEEGTMTYIITEPCLETKDASCVEVCPVDCIYEGDDQFYIHPDECIDCGACEPECPVQAIFPDTDVPPEWTSYIEKNRVHFE
jgi:ferredoxin